MVMPTGTLEEVHAQQEEARAVEERRAAPKPPPEMFTEAPREAITVTPIAKPVAAPPVMEGIDLPAKPIARGFTIPKDSKVVESDVTGKPTVYEARGERYYTPASTMWKMGYETGSQYQQFGQTDRPQDTSPFVEVMTPQGSRHIPRQTAIELSKLSGERLFNKQVKVGLIPKGSVYAGEGTYIPAVEGRRVDVEAIKAFEAELKKAPPRLRAIYEKGGIEAYNKAIAKEIKAFRSKHIELADGQWMLAKEWNKLPEKYQSIGLHQGFTPMLSAIKADTARGEAIIATMDKGYQVNGGYNLALALKDKAVTASDLEFIGFKKSDIKKAATTAKVATKTGVAVVGERHWVDLQTKETYTDAERLKLIEASPGKVHQLALTPASGRRVAIQAVSYIVPAARVGLPEYDIKDISAAEWGLSIVNPALIASAFAPGAIMGTLGGKAIITGLSTTGAGFLGYEAKKNWAELTPTQRAIGVGGTVLYALPMMATVGRGVKFSTAKPIPTVKGEVPTWKGLSVFKNPVIGRSGGRWVIGARDITIPEARLILEGYKPEMMLETKVFTNPKVLSKAGFTQTQIKFLADSLKARNLFAGKKSPFLSKDALIEPTAYIDADEMGVFLKQIGKYNTKVKNVDMLYGGTTIKAQLAPELRGWRQIHDLDMHTIFTLDEAKAFVNETLALLKKLPTKHKYRISPKSPVRIEKFVKGKWEHLNDLKSEAIDPSLQISEVPASKLDTTGAYSYGKIVAEPAITVEYPGVGKFDIMSLSESGVRKADTILRVRQTPEGVAFRPPERGIASPGVPKDAADFYVILQTYEKAGVLQPGTSKEWLESWAKAMGYSADELPKLMPNLEKAALAVAEQTPSNLMGYRFTPASSTKVPPGASPTIAIHTPSSLGASVSGDLASSISTPVPLYALSPTAKASISSAAASVVPSGYPIMVSPAPSPAVKPSVAPSPVPSPVPLPVPSAKPIPPSAMPSPKPSPTLEAAPSPIPSPAMPSPKPSPVPTPSPIPTTPPHEPEPGKPPPTYRLIPRGGTDEEKRKAISDSEGAIAWRQGELGGKDVWHCIKYPYESEADYLTVLGRKPDNTTIVRGPGSAYQTIKLRYGKPPSKKVTGDIGFFDFSIEPKNTDKVGISFTPDPKMETTGDITIGRPSPPITERPPRLSRRGILRITPKRPPLRR